MIAGSKVWFDGYDGEESILFDDFVGGPPVTLMLQILDIYPLRVEVKGGTVQAKWVRVYITSNLEVREWWDGSMYPEHRAALERRLTRVEIM